MTVFEQLEGLPCALRVSENNRYWTPGRRGSTLPDAPDAPDDQTVARRQPKKRTSKRPKSKAKAKAKARSKPRSKSTALAKRDPQGLAPLIADDLEYAAELAAGARAVSTERAYDTDIRAWGAYAEERGLRSFPANSGAFAAFIGHLSKSGLKLSTIRRRCSAVAQWHRDQGEISPTDDPKIKQVLRGLARKHKKAPVKKRALTGDMVRRMVEKLDPSTKQGLRDQAILLMGIATGLRRSELASMEWSHVTEESGDLIVLVPSSKTDQEGEGQYVAVPKVKGAKFCPVKTLQAWKKMQTAKSDLVFGCSEKTIARVVKRHIEALGYDASEFGAHSFRSGYMTEAERSGASLEDSMRQSRHKSHTVAQGYVQHLKQAKNPATLGVLRRLQGEEDDE